MMQASAGVQFIMPLLGKIKTDTSSCTEHPITMVTGDRTQSEVVNFHSLQRLTLLVQTPLLQHK